MRGKRTAVFLLTAAMLSGVFAGCGNGNNSDENAKISSVTEATEETLETQSTNQTLSDEVKETKQLVFRWSDGTIGYTQEAFETVKGEVAKSGLGVEWTVNVINDYFKLMEGKDNSSIDITILNNIISSFKQKLDAQQQSNQAQHQNNQNSNQGSNNNNNSGSNNNSNSDDSNNNQSNEAPDDWETPEVETPTDPWAGDGSFKFDDMGDGGPLVSDHEIGVAGE